MTELDRSRARYDGALAATIEGIANRIRQRGVELSLANGDRLDGRTCLVTGANRGLGLAVAHDLAKRGGTLVLACRSGLDETVAAIQKSAKRPELVTGVKLDLGDLESVEETMVDLQGRGVKIDVTILNAGIVPREARRTRDGFDESFQVNFLANVLFSRRLLELDLVGSSPTIDLKPRIVVVSSESHRSSPTVDWPSFGTFRPWGMRQAVEQYGYGKLLLQLYTQELSRRLENLIAVHSLCPGAVRTDIGREAPSWAKPLLDVTMRAFFQSPEHAAVPVVYLAASRAIESETGIYLHARQRKAPSEAATDPGSGRRIWDEAERLLSDAGHAVGE
ncbi:MAG: SDR family NAD(P)-dependent oxidoreductase [Polyangiaceae bacterium]|nr:SDR family NAD(P)-dependent oxidoreductase [Polyangiaceae bacterium]